METRAPSTDDAKGNAQRSAAADPAKRCGSGHTYDLVKRELFRRAAEVRGRDDAVFERLASAAALRVERPVVTSRDEGLGSIACSATVAIDLPPGLAVAGGRTTLTADLAYSLQPAADATGDVVTLTNPDAITVPLATLGRSGAAQASAAPSEAVPVPVPADPLAPRPAAPSAPPVAAPPRPPSPAPATPAPPLVQNSAANPSFSCARARTRGEQVVCGDPGLALLDRRMAAQYRAAYAAADPERRDVLRSTAHRFYGFRDNCPTNSCVASGYRERMREIDDIMRGGGFGDDR